MIALSLQKMDFFPKARSKNYTVDMPQPQKDTSISRAKKEAEASCELSDKEAYCCDHATD
jgi:hypothetical protein